MVIGEVLAELPEVEVERILQKRSQKDLSNTGNIKPVGEAGLDGLDVGQCWTGPVVLVLGPLISFFCCRGKTYLACGQKQCGFPTSPGSDEVRGFGALRSAAITFSASPVLRRGSALGFEKRAENGEYRKEKQLRRGE